MYLTMRDASFTRTGGFSLVEVLVAMLVLAIGLLGLAGLQASGLRYSGDAVLRTQAVTLAQDIIERMRASPEGVKSSPSATANTYYKITSTLTGSLPDCTSSTCNTSTMASYDVLLWQQTLTQRLPEGQGTINVTDTGGGLYYTVTVTVAWKERQTESSVSANRTLVLTTQI